MWVWSGLALFICGVIKECGTVQEGRVLVFFLGCSVGSVGLFDFA